MAIYQYHHVDPVFADATKHESKCIVLLCGGCHDRVGRGLLSIDTIKKRGDKPKCKESGFSFGPFDIGSEPIEIKLGTILARNTKTLIRVCGDDVFSICPPEEDGGPFILDVRFFDADGTSILDIVANEWRSWSVNWDVEIKGTRIFIRKSPGNFTLILRSEPPQRLVIERMDMFHEGMRLCCQEDKSFYAITPHGTVFEATTCELEDCIVGIDVAESRIEVGRGGTMRVPGTVMMGRISRNAPCFCKSGLRYKRCHGRIV